MIKRESEAVSFLYFETASLYIKKDRYKYYYTILPIPCSFWDIIEYIYHMLLKVCGMNNKIKGFGIVVLVFILLAVTCPDKQVHQEK